MVRSRIFDRLLSAALGQPQAVQTNDSKGVQMSMQDRVRDRPGTRAAPRNATAATRHRRTTETKAAFKTTEFVAYLAVLVALIIAGAVVDQSDAGGLGAKQVWLYATILTAGYMISRGLAKSGSRDPYWEDDDTGRYDGR
jgi:hypothetical protein